MKKARPVRYSPKRERNFSEVLHHPHVGTHTPFIKSQVAAVLGRTIEADSCLADWEISRKDKEKCKYKRGGGIGFWLVFAEFGDSG